MNTWAKTTSTLEVPAVVKELNEADLLPHPDALTVNGSTIGANCSDAKVLDQRVIWPIGAPLVTDAGFVHLSGNLFDSAIMKTSVISEEFRNRYLSNPEDPDAFEGKQLSLRGLRTTTVA